MNTTISRKRSPLVIVLATISLLLGILGVLCVALSMIAASLIAGYRSSQWFMVIAPVLALFPLSLLLTVFQGSSLLFGAFAVASAWLKRARKTLPVAAVALALVEIAAVRFSMGRFALQNPVYSMYLHLDSTHGRRLDSRERHQAREFSEGDLTPLMKAAEAGRAEEVRDLLRRGADPFEKKMGGWTACGLAVKNGRLDIVKAFLEEAPALDHDNGYLGVLLKVAAIHDRPDIARFLLDHHAEVDKKSLDGWTPLLNAVYHGNEEVVALLIAQGADVNTRNDVGRTPLMSASHRGHINIVEILLENGADMNAQNIDGATALMLASEAGHTEIVKLLVERGADLDMKNNQNRTAMEYAGCTGQVDVIRLLQQYGLKK